VRIDIYLSAVCVLKTRSLAKEACDRGKIGVNGVPAKASHRVHPGDHIRLDLGTRILEIEVVGVPEGQIARKQATEFFKVLSDQRT
jgi:ribosomal 50S subunit-recycling heat shock protein